MKQLKVGKWYLKYTKNQQIAFYNLWERQTETIANIRRFITDVRKEFGDISWEQYGYFNVSVDNKKHYYSCDARCFVTIKN